MIGHGRRVAWLVLMSLSCGGVAGAAPTYYFGADLSYVNELEDCGASYQANGKRRDPFELLHERGANLVRVRLWNDARWTRYSNLADVKKTIGRAHRAGMRVLLNFHYSDDWADGDKQIIPRAWESITDTDQLAGALYDFTLHTLRELDAAGLMPELVQVGNETNGEVLSTLARAKEPINWSRNAKLLNAGLRAVRDAGATSRVKPRVMLHVAQPENVEPWFAAATAAGVTDYDLIGISYYRKWSKSDLKGLGETINRMRHRYRADVLLVEAAYPWTLDNADTYPNSLAADSLNENYPATPLGQRRYLLDLSQLVIANGGVGVVYWEPAWISTRCETRWGKGSGWDNATLFDFERALLPGADYLDHPYIYPVDVAFRLKAAAGESAGSWFLWGDFLGAGMEALRVAAAPDGTLFRTRLMPGQHIRFQLYADAERRRPLLPPDPGDPEELVRARVGLQASTFDLAPRPPATLSSELPGASSSFNSGWQFYRFDDSKDSLPRRPGPLPESGWVEVTLPHTPRIEPRIVSDEQWQGDAIYRKAFAASPGWRGKRVWLRFEAAMNIAQVTFNGRPVLTHLGGYLPFVIDVTDALRFDAENEIALWLDNRDNAITGPKPLKILDFNTYGGLYRDVSVVVKEPLHITDEMMANRVAGGGVFVTYPSVTAERAKVAVKTQVRNDGRRTASFRVVQTLHDGDRIVGSVKSPPLRLAPGAELDEHAELVLDRPRLWSPSAPHLYRLNTTVEVDGRLVDARQTRIGVRRIEITRDGFSINGERMFLRGVNRHQEYPHVGYATSAAVDHRDARLIKEAGFDFVRLSHYPHSPAFMAAADELGLVLLNAVLGWQYFNPDPAFERQVLQTCRDLIRRDRNHASVIAWECSLNETQMPVDLVRAFHRIVHEEYPGDQTWSAGWQNDGYDIYIQARQHRIEHYEPPDRPYLVSEYGDWEYYALNAGFNQEAWADLQPEARTSRQLLSDGEARLLQQATNNQEAHNDNFTTPAFADAYWVMFDYNRGYADDLEASGLMSLDRVPKFNHAFFRSQRDAQDNSPHFASGPFISIASYWDSASAPRIRVYANVEEVELRLNGRVIERRRPDTDRISTRLRHPPFSFALAGFEPGSLEALGYVGDRVVAQHRVSTPEAPVRLRVDLDDAGICPEVAVGDLVFARARVEDRNGTVVPVSGLDVNFNVGAGLAPVGPTTARTEAGIASILVRVDAAPPWRAEAGSGELRGRTELGASAGCDVRAATP